jgi:hypothetical protein
MMTLTMMRSQDLSRCPTLKLNWSMPVKQAHMETMDTQLTMLSRTSSLTLTEERVCGGKQTSKAVMPGSGKSEF